jgi:hypothetical protein
LTLDIREQASPDFDRMLHAHKLTNEGGITALNGAWQWFGQQRRSAYAARRPLQRLGLSALLLARNCAELPAELG